uniref:Integrin, alpha 10 n=1 Tax=Astyanax mexicanus TaxID=7994 RepID=A0A3B1JEF1_ASTMX
MNLYSHGGNSPCLSSFSGLSECFNIDVKQPRIFTGPEDALFGFSVLQHEMGGEKLMLVGAPWDGPPNNRKGDIYKCIVGDELNSNCSKVNMADNAFQNVSRNLKNSHLGMTLTPDDPNGFLACAPLWSQECGTSVFSTGICASVNKRTTAQRKTIAPTAQRCTTYMDIVIVLDGSNSIYPWYEVQNFLSNILSKFHISPEQMQVGILQYGEISVHEWSLKDYQSTQDVVEAAKNISRQGKGRETRTAYAIHMACTEAFSAERGARDGATKVMIVVTDGESHDGEELPEALIECEKRNITRYAIAVLGHYIRRQQDPETFINEIKYIASDPDEKYFFNVTDEAALNDIVDALGDRIFSLEGTLGYNESAFEMEMSQIGFSTHMLDDGILFGMVGAYDWEGGVLKESSDGRIMPPREAFEKEFPLELKNHAAYLGYTVSSVIVGDWRRLYVAGAPRFKHKGKVILFDLSPYGDVTITQAFNGEQIGSYFGSEVCAVDVDQDGITDILLIAAPMFLGAGNKETGKVYIYCLDGDGFTPNGTLQTQPRAQDARFGYAMAVAPDLNHDSYADLLVGAPLEDDHQGALYIYHGDEFYIIPQYKQRVSGSSLSAGLQYFGRSLSALMDMDGDELLDLAVGAQGSAVLLRSRSIVQINVSLSFQPHSINVIQKNCQRGGRDSACLTASACFFANSRSPGAYGTQFEHYRAPLRFLYCITVCQNEPVWCVLCVCGVCVWCVLCVCVVCIVCVWCVLCVCGVYCVCVWCVLCVCVFDRSPFIKDCGEDDVCVTDLVLKAHMDISGEHGKKQQPYVIRSPRRRLAVEVQLQNRLENAYNTSLTLQYSRNLHFSSLSIRVTHTHTLYKLYTHTQYTHTIHTHYTHTHTTHTLYTLYTHAHTLYTLYTHNIHTLYTHYTHTINTVHTRTHTIHTHYKHCTHTIYTHYTHTTHTIHTIHTLHTLHTHCTHCTHTHTHYTHTHTTHTIHTHTIHTHYTHTHMLHTHYTHTHYTHTLHTHYTLYTHTLHTQYTHTHTQYTHTLYTHTIHSHTLYTLTCLSISQEDAQFKMECTALSSSSPSCNVSYPVFRSQSKVLLPHPPPPPNLYFPFPVIFLTVPNAQSVIRWEKAWSVSGLKCLWVLEVSGWCVCFKER